MDTRRRAVITGMGIWSCIGTSLDAVAQSLREGRSGIVADPDRCGYGYRSSLTGRVERPVLKGLLDRHLRVGFAEQGEYAYMAAREALQTAGIDADYIARNEMGIIFGNDSSAQPVIEAARIMDARHDSGLLGRGAVFQSMNSTVTMNLAAVLGLRGVNFTVSAACASSSHAVGLARMYITQGLQDIVLVGGAQETNRYSMATFDGIAAFSRRMDSPAQASRPFDRDRDGLVPSGGAAALVVEEYGHARRRGATILAELAGYGFSSSGVAGLSQPDDRGSAIAMRRALDAAGITAEQVDYVNAHATSTPQGDAQEARALKAVLGQSHALVSSTKAMTGHECWMAGASEVVYSLLMMQHGFVAPNINFEHPDADTDGLNLATETVLTDVNTVLSNSFGFGGTNAALVLRRMTD